MEMMIESWGNTFEKLWTLQMFSGQQCLSNTKEFKKNKYNIPASIESNYAKVLKIIVTAV